MLAKTKTIVAQTRTSISSVVSCLNTLWLLYPQAPGTFAGLFVNFSLPDLAVVHGREGLDPYLRANHEDQKGVRHAASKSKAIEYLSKPLCFGIV